ncbi:MAG: nucleotidyltransferase family protein [Pseudomonadota bacterium]|nr:nucleotidyltransferase family protein [Pseudomonadota bacterium]
MINTLMILAAGRGKRMMHLTDDKPKPLVSVLGRTLLDRVIDHALTQGIQNFVINTCYKGEMIEKALVSRGDISPVFSREEEALETGGGILNALPLLLPKGANGFFVANADPLWVDKTTSIFHQLEEKWNPNTMDVLIALIPRCQAFGAVHSGDYFIEEQIPRRKRPEENAAPYFFTGIQIIHPRIFNGVEKGVFSLVKLYDKAQNAGKLSAVIYDGDWYHVGTPEALKQTEDRLRV